MSKFLQAVLDEERWPIDRLLPETVRSTIDDLRRGRLLIVATFILTAAAFFFGVTSYESNRTWLGVAGILVLGSVFAIANVPLLWTLGLRRTSALLCAEHVFFVWVSGLAGSGVVESATPAASTSV